MDISASQAHRRNFIFPLIIIGALFFIFGFITWANSQLIPYLKIACELTTTQSFYVASAFLKYGGLQASWVDFLTIPATIGEFWMIGYLLVFGIRPQSSNHLK